MFKTKKTKKETKMFRNYLFRPISVIAYTRRNILKKTSLAVLVPMFILTSFLMTPKTITYLGKGGTVALRSNPTGLSAMVGDPSLNHWPGHDFGAIDSEFSLATGLPSSGLFAYTISGVTMLRRSELGPLTGALDFSYQKALPGHDFGAIGGELSSYSSLPSIGLIDYNIGGMSLARSSELGPLTGALDYSYQKVWEGQNFGAIGGESKSNGSSSNIILNQDPSTRLIPLEILEINGWIDR
jgi:hypothetical protein